MKFFSRAHGSKTSLFITEFHTVAMTSQFHLWGRWEGLRTHLERLGMESVSFCFSPEGSAVKENLGSGPGA